MKKKGLLVLFMAAVMSVSSFASACGSNNHTHKHVYEGDWTVAEADKPTETSTGKAKRYCTSDDGGEQILELPALSDSRYVITNNSATATAGGYGTYTITVDGVTVSFFAATPATGSGNQGGGEGGGEGGGDEGGGETSENTYSVVFYNGSTVVETKTVNEGSAVTAPVLSQDGKYLSGWNTRSDGTGVNYDFSSPVTSSFSLYAQWITMDAKITYSQSGYEAAAFEWNDTNAAVASVYYKAVGTADYTQVDSALVRTADSDTARVDILGLQGNTQYSFKIVTSAGTEINVENMAINAYDRSGYAHFNYGAGVGAYNDDGTLKTGALVIYLTEENKNNVKDYVYRNGQKVDITQYVTDSSGVAHWGIGEIFNNRRYSGNDRANVGIANLCRVYGAVSLRIIGQVENVMTDGVCSIIGLTDYDSTNNGGTVGDSGGMARMCNAKNVTVEGVGEDAVVKGWGFHFVSSTISRISSDDGKSFEARNLTFTGYPEDALGMEGEQDTKSATGTIVASVERCWVHNNSFYTGGNGTAAESDKGEGDGSCDFKRGQYYTFSYNYLDSCHKTNLIGSASYSLQFNISMHHNWWNDCQSRIPLVRRSNVHFYNNYVSVTGEAAKTSHVHSVRASAYLFSEANYYDGCKTVAENGGEGGNIGIKGYNDVYYACWNGDDTTIVTDREAQVANGCEYSSAKIDYSSFDTDATLFYYDAEKKQSECYLTDAVTARRECMTYAGVQKRSYDDISTDINKYTPTGAVEVPSEGELNVDLTSVSKGTCTVSGILFTTTGVSSGTVKGKGQVVTFTLVGDTDIAVTVSGTAENNLGELVRSDGTVYATKFSSVSMTLPAGTYFIGSGNKDKEVTITSLKFKEGATDEEKIAGVEAAIAAIPATVDLSVSCAQSIKSARMMYNNLRSELQARVSNYATLTAAETQYSTLQINNVINLIDAIGTVDYNSGSAISAARSAYSGLSSAQQSQVTNYTTLTAAEETYAGFAVQAVQNAIDSLPDVATLTTREQLVSALESYNDAKQLYEGLDEDQIAEITNYSKITAGISAIEEALKPYELKDMIGALPETYGVEDVNAIGLAKTLYNSLNESQKAVLTEDEITKLTAAIAFYDEEMAKTKVVLFYNGSDYASAGVTVSGDYSNSVTYTYDGQTYNALKIESKTTITFTVTEGQTVELYTSKSNAKIKIDGVDYTSDANGVVTVEGLESGTHTITKNATMELYYMIIR